MRLLFLLTFLYIHLIPMNSLAQEKVFNNPFQKEDSVKKIVLLNAIADIGYIQSGEKVEFSDSISHQNMQILDSLLVKNKDTFKVDKISANSDTSVSNNIKMEINTVLSDQQFQEKNKKWALPPFIDSILMETGYTYGYLFFQNGFVRKKGNYRSQVWKAIGIGVLSMGNYIASIQKSSSNMYLFWLDGKNKTIACMDRQEWNDKDPIERKLIENEFNKIIQNKSWRKN